MLELRLIVNMMILGRLFFGGVEKSSAINNEATASLCVCVCVDI